MNNTVSDVTRGKFLQDVLICALGAYGGPEAHFGVITEQMVTKKHYLTEEELIELIALSGLLPGPSSTQTIVAIGYKIGGPALGFWTMLVWALPPLILMTALSFLYGFLQEKHLSDHGLRLIGPMAVGFIVIAAIRIGHKVVTNRLTATIGIGSVLLTYFIRAPWIFPLVMILSGVLSVWTSGESQLWNKVSLRPKWRWLVAFVGFAVTSYGMMQVTNSVLIALFEKFYRYGYLVFGGGQVVVPMMYTELVEVAGYMSGQEFLTGYGLVQGVPGQC